MRARLETAVGVIKARLPFLQKVPPKGTNSAQNTKQVKAYLPFLQKFLIGFWFIIVIALFTLIVVAGRNPQFSNPLGLSLSNKDVLILGKISLIAVLLLLLLHSHTRRAWPEIVMAFLVLPTLLILLTTATAPLKAAPAAKPTPPKALLTGAILNLPVAKIQSDLSGLLPGSNVTLLLVADHQVHRYSAQVVQVLRVVNTPIPYANEQASAVSIRLTNATDDTILNFVNQLSDANTIYVLPLQ